MRCRFLYFAAVGLLLSLFTTPGCDGKSPASDDGATEQDAGGCIDAAAPCTFDPGVSGRCEGDTLHACVEMMSAECGTYGVEVTYSCADTCTNVIEYPTEVDDFEFSHCGTETQAGDGAGDCWCAHPTDGRLARGNWGCLHQPGSCD